MKAFLLLCLTGLLAGQTPEERRVQIDQALRELTEISGLKSRKRIDYDVITRDKVTAFLQERIRESVKPEQLRAEELTLKKFGFVPPDFDLKKSTVELLTEQAAAFYDYHKKKLFITDWTSSAMQRTALVHELAHALADQNFHLERFIREAGKSDDRSLARLAVMEGQASWLTAEYLARKSGQTWNSPEAIEAMSRATETGEGQYPIFDKTPMYLRETLVFPYTQGMLFQNALHQKLGRGAFAEIFRKPPVSTQQVLHPDKYFSGTEPVSPQLPVFNGKKGWTRLIDGNVGELDHAILIRQYAGKPRSEALAPAWRGGSYAIFQNRSEGRTVLAYASQWENADKAQDFFRAYREVLQKKWKHMETSSEAADSLAGKGDDGYFLVRLNGSTVTSLEGLPEPDSSSPETVR